MVFIQIYTLPNITSYFESKLMCLSAETSDPSLFPLTIIILNSYSKANIELNILYVRTDVIYSRISNMESNNFLPILRLLAKLQLNSSFFLFMLFLSDSPKFINFLNSNKEYSLIFFFILNLHPWWFQCLFLILKIVCELAYRLSIQNILEQMNQLFICSLDRLEDEPNILDLF